MSVVILHDTPTPHALDITDSIGVTRQTVPEDTLWYQDQQGQRVQIAGKFGEEVWVLYDPGHPGNVLRATTLFFDYQMPGHEQEQCLIALWNTLKRMSPQATAPT